MVRLKPDTTGIETGEVMNVTTVINEHVIDREAIDVLLVGGTPSVRERLRQLLDGEPGFNVAGDAPNAAKALRAFAGATPDVVIVSLSGSPLARTMRTLRRFTAAGTRTILLANAIEKTNIVQAQQLGVAGIVSKDAPPQLLFESVRSVAAGYGWLGRAAVDDLAPPVRSGSAADRFGLTEREMDVVAAVVRSFLSTLN
jgi:DNA-binding NarL/FixJ family response regulator